jgi:hypothetical protein
VRIAPRHNSGVLAFLEPGVVAIGNLPGIQRAIDAQMNGQSITSNAEMMDLVKDIERTNNSWAVGRFDLIANRAKLPEQVARQIPPIKWFAFASQINGGISGRVRVEALDDQSAENLRGIVNGVISWRGCRARTIQNCRRSFNRCRWADRADRRATFRCRRNSWR